ncbi:hypothetical protein GXW83_18195 [Streptacidiphilus sp. PB12-B1b]|uniref:alkaline phosphatase family protein n=1 Tax=Streptacidiphilus sp. PB12-B1b TaxID=2705012 RepID=UPI0015F93AB7|nr:alkaline phosphatase family protein [Streptacidiphilus sp. PB12-B1b]QMU77342.1 hypothetical protein GXW83_18195 [Streptacidiphilus sp. PB12-B1b]
MNGIPRRLGRWRRAVLAVACASLLALAAPPGLLPTAAADTAPTTTPIKHFIYLMQGPRSFDDYFGTFPGAEGFPAGACQSQGKGRPCVSPHPLHGRPTAGLPGTDADLVSAQVDSGRMDGFVSAYTRQGRDGADAMGYYDAADLPTDWAAAERYVLFDQFHSDAQYGTAANRCYWIAATDPDGDRIPSGGYGDLQNIFDRLDAAGVSWKFYVQSYRTKTSSIGAGSGTDDQAARVPLLDYHRFLDDPALRGHIGDLSQYYADLADGRLPAVAYVASSGSDERSAHSIRAGQQLIQTMVDQLMVSRYWSSSAFFWSYEQAGGWYDQYAPPKTAAGTLGLRVPAILVSPYARVGTVDSTPSAPESALRFIEQNWGLAPLTARDADAASLAGAFDFDAGPRQADLLPGPASGVPPLTAAAVDTGPAITLYSLVAALCAVLLAAAASAAGLRRLRRRGAAAGLSHPRSDSGGQP